ncbi:hypothetical protein SDC9_108872 [bioreactor metagenome]|uniref:Uncharacterized protein n=1 Tax=bioreactor metagenome TaxID=1076179 RepID=A0A645B9D1_9ZZZZ
MVEDVLAGEPVHQQARRHVEGPRRRVRRGLLLPEPGELRPDRLGGQVGVTGAVDLLGAEQLVQFADLLGGAGVDPVQGRRRHPMAVRIAEHQGRSHARHPDGGEPGGGERAELGAQGDELVPPHLAVHRDQPGAAAVDPVRTCRTAQDPPVEGDGDGFRAGGTDIHPEHDAAAHGPQSASMPDERTGGVGRLRVRPRPARARTPARPGGSGRAG